MMLPAHREAELEGIIELAKPAAYIVVEKYLGFFICADGKCDEREIFMYPAYICR